MHVVNQSEKQFKYIRELNDNDTMFGFGGSTLYTSITFDINLNLNIGKGGIKHTTRDSYDE